MFHDLEHQGRERLKTLREEAERERLLQHREFRLAWRTVRIELRFSVLVPGSAA